MDGVYIHESAVVDDGANIGAGTKVWHFAHIFSGAVIGEACSLGQNTMVADSVTIGRNVKVQNNVAVYSGTVIEDDVFLGPSCVLTNVSNPRSQVIRQEIYETTRIRRGATVGANATIVCGVTLGRYCFVAAGAVVTRDISDYALIAGVPGRQVGWMSRHGHKLNFDKDGKASCVESGFQYQLSSRNDISTVQCLGLDEDCELPLELAVGKKPYRELKQ